MYMYIYQVHMCLEMNHNFFWNSQGSSEVSCEMTSPPIEVKNDSAEYPRTFKHSFNSLSPFTVYRLFTNATYSSFNSSNGQLLGPVIDVSNYTEITTAGWLIILLLSLLLLLLNIVG